MGSDFSVDWSLRWASDTPVPEGLLHHDRAGIVAAGPDGSLAVAGSKTAWPWHIDDEADAVVLGVGAAGSVRWVDTYRGDNLFSDWATGVAVGDDGVVYATVHEVTRTVRGGDYLYAASSELVLLAYGHGGERRWRRVIETRERSGADVSFARPVVFDGSPHVVFERIDDRSRAEAAVIVRLDAQGGEHGREEVPPQGRSGGVAAARAVGDGLALLFHDSHDVVLLDRSLEPRWRVIVEDFVPRALAAMPTGDLVLSGSRREATGDQTLVVQWWSPRGEVMRSREWELRGPAAIAVDCTAAVAVV